MTDDRDYTDRLVGSSGARWKRLLNVQAPYRWNLRRLHPGRTLDVGCGIGRNLDHLDGNGVGVDTNPTSVAEARRRGFEAHTVEEVACRGDRRRDASTRCSSPTCSNTWSAGRGGGPRRPEYLPIPPSPAGLVITIVPQEAGYASDATHVEFLDADDVASMYADQGVTASRSSARTRSRSHGSPADGSGTTRRSSSGAAEPEDRGRPHPNDLDGRHLVTVPVQRGTPTPGR